MVNALVQLVTLLNGLLLNFLAPAVYGLHAFGEFIAANALVFLVYKCVTIMSEPLIRLGKPTDLLIILLSLSAVVVAIMMLVSLVWPSGSLLMLVGILVLSNVQTSLQAMRWRRMYVGVQSLAICLFVGLLAATHFEYVVLTIGRLMVWATLIPASVGVVALFVKRVHVPTLEILRQSLVDLVRHMPNMLSVTAVMNLFTNAMPLLLASVLIPRELGLFRVATALIQATTSVFPISTQAALAAFNRAGELATKLYILLAQFALLYFASAALVLMVVAQAIPQFAPYLTLVACLPAYYHAILAERLLTSQHALRSLRIANLAICVVAISALLLVHTLGAALLHYAIGLTIYALVLSIIIAARGQGARSTIVLMALCPLAVATTDQHPWVSMGVMGFVIAVVMHRRVFSVAELRSTLRDI